ncbi:MAG: transposase, partial [Pseudomonadota bacterium]
GLKGLNQRIMIGLNKLTHQAINLLFKPCKFDFSAFAPFAELVLPFFPSKLKQVAHQHESFWVRLQHELLNETLYRSLWQAQRLIAEWQTDYSERFNGTLRCEVLNAAWFTTTHQAQVVINSWLKQYNHVRPHHALGMRAPAPETLFEEPPNLWTRRRGLDAWLRMTLRADDAAAARFFRRTPLIT